MSITDYNYACFYLNFIFTKIELCSGCAFAYTTLVILRPEVKFKYLNHEDKDEVVG